MHKIIEVDVPQSPSNLTPKEFDAYLEAYVSKLDAQDAMNMSNGLTHRVEIMFDGVGDDPGRQVTYWEKNATNDGVTMFINRYIKKSKRPLTLVSYEITPISQPPSRKYVPTEEQIQTDKTVREKIQRESDLTATMAASAKEMQNNPTPATIAAFHAACNAFERAASSGEFIKPVADAPTVH